ncbi:hypothetical protein FRB94_000311 [Tulasnella sp. JGI-2019a]|nr:hypothetical protein FRB93_003200 [Tulasnella sp. JGI-2019a]KAG9006900.1 hypothetical protein FRB94_000311 [Tulasnella sp. JGI-2019a]
MSTTVTVEHRQTERPLSQTSSFKSLRPGLLNPIQDTPPGITIHKTHSDSSNQSLEYPPDGSKASTSSIHPRDHRPGSRVSRESIELQNLSDLSKGHSSPGVNNSGTGAPKNVFNMSISNERIYLASLCFSLFLAGWNDATLGPLLPRIQDVYNISYTPVSILFISQCIGSMSGSGCNMYLTDKLGFGKLVVASAAVQAVVYAVLSSAPPFPVFCVFSAVNGFAIALQDAHANTFIASIPRHASTNMGILHAIYGLGAFTAPLIATQFAQMQRWSFHFLVSMVFAVLNTGTLLYVFRGKRQEFFISETTSTSVNGEAQVQHGTGTKYKKVLGHRAVQLMSAYILVYVGVEVTIGGWIFTYLLNERNGGPSAGYVSSGFFGGLTLGRVVLLPLTKKLGHNAAVYLYLILSIALEFTIWFVPNLIGNAVAVSFVGLFLGPMFPISMNVATNILPAWYVQNKRVLLIAVISFGEGFNRMLGGSIGFIAATGQAGSAILPFVTGALSNRYGVRVLEPLLVAMLFLQITIWFFVTNLKVSRTE